MTHQRPVLRRRGAPNREPARHRLNVLDSGSLSVSWRQQPGTPGYCTELTASELKSALQFADRARALGNRDALLKEFMAAGGELAHDDTVARNRAVTA